ncbi:MAG TPA: delta-60 repeat domain-containing protein [Blastocatellia bacterium]|nr:delta-60 repeat domain-containing protein [Blastocatellia bacterium]
MITHKNPVELGSRNLTRATSCVLVLLLALMTIDPRATNIAHAADGDLDLTFGEGGTVVTDFSRSSEVVTDIKVQPDGKIVAVGATALGFSSGEFALARYNDNGSLDPSFGNGGKVVTNFGVFGGASSLEFQPGGKILVAGHAYANGTDFGLARYNSDGSLDLSFGDNGKVIESVGSADGCFGMIVQPDGKILLAGYAGRGDRQASSFCVVRYNSNGRLDSSFGKDGVAKTAFSDGFDDAFAIALQPDGKIVLAGSADLNRTKSPIAVARYNTDGTPDTSFGNEGKLTLKLLGSRSQANAVAIQPNGKIILAGWVLSEALGREVFAVARLNSNGALDTNFGSGGVVTNELSARGGEAQDLLLQRDGKIIVAGFAGFTRSSSLQVFDFAILRYDSNGALDDSFGQAGILTTNFQRRFNSAFTVTLQPDGKLIAAGSSTRPTAEDVDGVGSDFALARYNNINTSSFDICIKDDSNGNMLQIDSLTGEYKFTACSASLNLAGTGSVKVKGCKITLKHAAIDRTISVTINSCKDKASASIEVLSSGRSFALSDSDTAQGACVCQ